MNVRYLRPIECIKPDAIFIASIIIIFIGINRTKNNDKNKTDIQAW
jgi:hypothetical protein